MSNGEEIGVTQKEKEFAAEQRARARESQKGILDFMGYVPPEERPAPSQGTFRQTGTVPGEEDEPLYQGEFPEAGMMGTLGGVEPPEPPGTVQDYLGGISTQTAPAWPGEFSGKGGAGAGMKISLEGTVGPQVPPEYTAEKLAYMQRMAQVESLGHQARANALGIQLDIMRDLEPAWQANFQETDKEIDRILSDVEEEQDSMNELMERVRTGRINPGQFFANVGGAGRFSAALAVAAGSMASAFGGGPNVAYDIIKNAIDRNVQAQVVNLRHGVRAAYAEMQFIHTLQGLANTKANLAHYQRMGLAQMAQMQIGQAQVGLQQAHAQLASQDVWNRLGAIIADAKIQAVTAMQSKATFKLTSLGQVSQVQNFLENQGRATGAAPAAGSGRRGAGRAPASGAAPPPISLRGSPEEVAKSAILSLKSQGRKISQQDMEAVATQLEANNQGAAATILRNTHYADFQPQESMERETQFVGGIGSVSYMITDPGMWKDKDRAEMRQNVLAPMQLLSKTHQAHELLGILNAGGDGLTRYLRVYHGDRKLLPLGDAELVKDAATIRLIKEDLMEAIRQSENTRNALNLRHEIERYGVRTGVGGLGTLEAMADFMLKRPDVWQARVVPALNKARDAVQEAEGLYGIRWVRE